MDEHHLHRLIKEYLDGTISEADKKTLLKWYHMKNTGDMQWDLEEGERKEDVKQRIFRKIERRSFSKKPSVRMRYVRYAATVLILISVSLGLLWSLRDFPFLAQAQINVSREQAENRHLVLPDSSIVILRPGSTLAYVTDFRGKTREVRLRGEAYFDVRSRPSQPFIIHTGDVKTTVLGTKFTVRTEQHTERIEVKVREGKVRVEREKALIAELTANQQVQYNEETEQSTQQPIPEEAVSFAWTAMDMRFDAMPFGDLTAKLERRYAVKILFENSALMHCPVSGKFDGTETLETVLDILCATRNARYTPEENGDILIKGDGC